VKKPAVAGDKTQDTWLELPAFCCSTVH